MSKIFVGIVFENFSENKFVKHFKTNFIKNRNFKNIYLEYILNLFLSKQSFVVNNQNTELARHQKLELHKHCIFRYFSGKKIRKAFQNFFFFCK